MKYLNIKEVSARYCISKSTIYRWVSENRFPKPKILGENCSRWLLADLTQWEENQQEVFKNA